MSGAMAAFVVLMLAQAPPLRQPISVDVQRAKQHDRNGWTALDSGHPDRAVTEFQAALQINPEYADALHGLGKAQVALQRYPDAVSALERCRLAYLHGGTQDAERRLIDTSARQAQLQKLTQELQQAQRSGDQSIGSEQLHRQLAAADSRFAGHSRSGPGRRRRRRGPAVHFARTRERLLPRESTRRCRADVPGRDRRAAEVR